MSKYEEARILAINGLEKALIAHANDNILSIEAGLEEEDKVSVIAQCNNILNPTYKCTI